MNQIHEIKFLMVRFIQSLLLISAFSVKAFSFPLKTGDLILQPTSCYLCGLIEAEEKTPYSHMGILVSDRGTWNVLEAWGRVRMTTLVEFLSRKKKNTQSLVLRLNEASLAHSLRSVSLIKRFQEQFDGLSYDSQFLWNNEDERGEKLYCSEFVAKFFEHYLLESIPTKPMHYEVNREFWIQYFQGTPPDGEPGLSPGDFERSPLFHKVGVL